MSIEIKCISCGERATVPDEAIDRKAQCNVCHALFYVRDAVESGKTVRSETEPSNKFSHRNRKRFSLGRVLLAILILAAFAGVFQLFSGGREAVSQRSISSEDRQLLNDPIPEETRQIAEGEGLDPRAFYIYAKKQHLNPETQKVMAAVIRNQMNEKAKSDADFSK